MGYRHLLSEERHAIAFMLQRGYTMSEAAREIGRSVSTVSREIRRNQLTSDGGYRPKKAHSRAISRRWRSRRNLRFGVREILAIERCIREDLSPEQAAGKLKKEGVLSISHETIYKHIWRDKELGGGLHRHLRCHRKRRRKRYRSYDSRGRLAGKRPIESRPASVESRRSVGHWEIDTVMGKGSQHCLLTAVERKTGFLVIRKLKSRTTRHVNRRMKGFLKQHARKVTTITADNGTEFNGYRDIEARSDVRFYFANPYHSWERGSNENANGLIRQYLPKGMDLKPVTQSQCDTIAGRLNRRPRKRLRFSTPAICYYLSPDVAVQT